MECHSLYPLKLCLYILQVRFHKLPTELRPLSQSVRPFFPFIFVLQSHDGKMGAANDYHTSNLQLAKERSWLITPYNVHQPVLQALRYIMLLWEADSIS